MKDASLPIYPTTDDLFWMESATFGGMGHDPNIMNNVNQPIWDFNLAGQHGGKMHLLDGKELDYIEHFLQGLSGQVKDASAVSLASNSSSSSSFSGNIRDIISENREIDPRRRLSFTRPEIKRPTQIIITHGPPFYEPFNPTGPKRPIANEDERRSRHILSEHRRRDRIKDELERMMELVPMSRPDQGRRSQARILAAANDYISWLKGENERMWIALMQMQQQVQSKKT